MNTEWGESRLDVRTSCPPWAMLSWSTGQLQHRAGETSCSRGPPTRVIAFQPSANSLSTQ